MRTLAAIVAFLAVTAIALAQGVQGNGLSQVPGASGPTGPTGPTGPVCGSSGDVMTNSAGACAGVPTTGSGDVVLATSPVMATPVVTTFGTARGSAPCWQYDNTSYGSTDWAICMAATGNLIFSRGSDKLTLSAAGNMTASTLANTAARPYVVTDSSGALSTGNLTAPSVAPTGGGSLVVADANNSATVNYFMPGQKNGPGTCSATGSAIWPIAGRVRNVTVATSGTNGTGVLLRAGSNVNCTAYGIAPQGTGPIVTSAAAAGAFVDASRDYNWQHVGQGEQLGLATSKIGTGGTAATVSSVAAEFVADSGTWAVLSSATSGISLSASTAAFWPPVGGFGVSGNNTLELSASVPVPVAGTIQYLSLCGSGVPAVDVSPVVRVSGANGPTVTVPSTVTSPYCFMDTTTSTAIAAHGYLAMSFTSGAGPQMTPTFFAVGFTPSSGTATPIVGHIGTTVSTTATYSLPGGSRQSTTQVNERVTMPFGCTLSSLDVVQATANGVGVTTTFTIQVDGVDSALTGTVTQASGTGVVQVDGVNSVAIAAGQTLALKYSTASGTSGTIGGWGVKCQP